MKRKALWLAPLLVAGASASAQDASAPWVLHFAHGPLECYTLSYRDGSARAFYYFTFTLTNKGTVDASLAAFHVKAHVGTSPKKRKVHVAVPEADAEEAVRRLGRADDLKNVQQINRMETLKVGESVRGIAVLGTFHREWDEATVLVYGLEPASRQIRARKYEGGFTLPHRAYARHNNEVLERAGAGAAFTEVHAIVHHNVVWKMVFHREGDEFAPHVDPIHMDSEGWDVVADPAPRIVQERPAPFAKG
jgi:hypothetical protein